MGYATTTTGHVDPISVSKDRRLLKSDYINGIFTNVFQNTTTTVEQYRGLSQTDAESVCVSSTSSTLSGVTRSYLGGVRVTIASGMTRTWFTVMGCWGTEVSSVLSRDSDSHLFSVTKTTKTMTIDVPGVSSSNITYL